MTNLEPEDWDSTEPEGHTNWWVFWIGVLTIGSLIGVSMWRQSVVKPQDDISGITNSRQWEPPCTNGFHKEADGICRQDTFSGTRTIIRNGHSCTYNLNDPKKMCIGGYNQ